MKNYKILLTICCITYNHERFIRSTLDSFLKQKTDFQIEIIIHDDASTDSTTEIIKEYHRKHFNLIRLIIQTENQFKIRKFRFLSDMFMQAQGKYIALCEGDDYWTDPYKLQKQVDFLESDPNFSVCFHKVKILKDNEIVEDYITQVPSQVSTIYDLIKGNYIHTPSCVFRNNVDKMFGDNFCHVSTADYYIHIMNAIFGKIYFIDEPMAVYRIHPGSFWSSRADEEKSLKALVSYICIYQDFSQISKDDELIFYFRKQLFLYSSALIPNILKYINKKDNSVSKSELNVLLSMYSDMCLEFNQLYNRQEFASYYLKQALLNLESMFLITLKKILNGYYVRRIISFFQQRHEL